jgi:hypothetical protein
MLEDTMESLDEDDMDEEVDDEVQKVLDELTAGKVIVKFYDLSYNKIKWFDEFIRHVVYVLRKHKINFS